MYKCSTSYPTSSTARSPELAKDSSPAPNVANIKYFIEASQEFSFQDAMISRNKLVPHKQKVPRGILPRCVKTSSVDAISNPACDMHYMPNSEKPQPHESQPIPTSLPNTRLLSLQFFVEPWIASQFPSFVSNVARIRIPAIARWWVQL